MTLFFGNLEGFSAANAGLYNWISQNLKKNSTCIDIGANLGLTAIAMAHFCPEGVVYAFEPSPKNLENLKANIFRNGINNIHVVASAVGFVEGFVNFNIPAAAGNCTVLRDAPVGNDYAPVAITTLDRWWAGNGQPPIDFIKIDVEGFETDVLKGASSLFTSCFPKSFIEFNSMTMIMEARISPLAFAEAVWNLFDVATISEDGSTTAALPPKHFTYLNLAEHGFMDDVLVVPKSNLIASDIVRTLPSSAPALIIQGGVI